MKKSRTSPRTANSPFIPTLGTLVYPRADSCSASFSISYSPPFLKLMLRERIYSGGGTGVRKERSGTIKMRGFCDRLFLHAIFDRTPARSPKTDEPFAAGL